MRYAKMNWLNSLSLKVLLAYAAGMVLSIALLMAAATAVLEGDALARMDLEDLAQNMAEKIRFDSLGQPTGLDVDEDDLAWAFETLKHETGYRLLDASGNVALRSSADHDLWPDHGVTPRLDSGRFDFEHDGAPMYGATAPVRHGGRVWYFQIAASPRLMTLLHRVALPLVEIGFVMLGLVMLTAFGLSAFITLRYTLKPLRDVSDSAAAISPRSIHTRLSTQGVPSEIAPLVDSFNRVLERLEKGYRVQKEFLSDAAHELKTPLALIRAQIELKENRDEDEELLLSDVDYMTRQVQQLLLLAEASGVRNYHFTTVRVREVADEAIAYLQRMSEAAGVRSHVSTTVDDVAWTADRAALFTLLKNLLENAIQHAPERTLIDVEVRADSISVRDRGPGADTAQLPLLFERFWRGEHRRDQGAGLGLAICQEIALAHGWRLSAERAEPGLRFRLSKGGPIDQLVSNWLARHYPAAGDTAKCYRTGPSTSC